MTGLPLNTHTATVTFLGSNDVPVDIDNDTDVEFRVIDGYGRELERATVPHDELDHPGTGQYAYAYVPEIGLVGVGFRVAGIGTVEGDQVTAWSELVMVSLP